MIADLQSALGRRREEEEATGSFSGILSVLFFFPYLPSFGLENRISAKSSQLLLTTACMYTLHRASPTFAQLHSFPALRANNPLQT